MNTDAAYGGADVVWIDNFRIFGSDIYNSNGFEDFDIGSLNDQDGWVAASGNGVVPEPGTAMLFGLGIIGLAGISRRKRNTTA